MSVITSGIKARDGKWGKRNEERTAWEKHGENQRAKSLRSHAIAKGLTSQEHGKRSLLNTSFSDILILSRGLVLFGQAHAA